MEARKEAQTVTEEEQRHTERYTALPGSVMGYYLLHCWTGASGPAAPQQGGSPTASVCWSAVSLVRYNITSRVIVLVKVLEFSTRSQFASS